MKNWRFAFSRRWFGYLALAVAFAIACVGLSQWQLGRNADAVANIKRIQHNYDAAPASVDDLLRTTTTWVESEEWRPVLLKGTYLRSKQLLVRNRAHGGNAGFEVLTPLRLADGTVFVVDRGWVQNGLKQNAPDFVPAAPTGEVTVIARLKQSETTIPGRSAPGGQIATIHLPAVAKEVGSKTYTGAYGLMATETPAPASRPAKAAKPTLDQGPYLSYAFQWLAFAVFGFFGLGWAIRIEYRIRNAEDPEERKRAEKRDLKARAKAPSDAEIEDALIDSRP